jgi:hypothetical protein
MGESFIESVPTQELNRLAEQAASGGEYEAARALINRELARRAALIEALHTVDMPVADPIDYLEEDYVHNHGPAEGRGLDCGERTVDGKLRGWCMDEYIVPVDPMDELNCESCQ